MSNEYDPVEAKRRRGFKAVLDSRGRLVLSYRDEGHEDEEHTFTVHVDDVEDVALLLKTRERLR